MYLMKRFYFRPNFTFTITVLILLPILISLGCWQLHRAEEKRQLQAKFAAKDKIAPITIEQAQNLPTNNNYYPIQVEGYFDNTHSFLLDNQFYRHAVGYHIITPLLSTKTHRWILINRGWLPMSPNRNILAKIPTISGKVYLKGFLYIPKNNPFISAEIESVSWPLRIEYINILSISKRLDCPFYPQLILLDSKSPYGFIRDWQPVNMKASTHIGYALQWFSFAVILVVIYLCLSCRRKP